MALIVLTISFFSPDTAFKPSNHISPISTEDKVDHHCHLY